MVKRLEVLDSLRGVFCLLIIFEHYSPLYIPDNIYKFPFIRHSYIVVDFFFVLSGFIITLKYQSYLNNVKNLWKFYKKRIFRLYPLLFFTSTTVLVFEFFSNIYLRSFKNNPDSSIELFNRFLNDVLLVNSTRILGDRAMNIPSWSISAEFICYLIFGIIFLLFCFGKINKNQIILLLITFALLITSFYYDSFFSTYRLGFLRGLYSFFWGAVFSFAYSYKIKINGLIQMPLMLLFFISFYLMSLKSQIIIKLLGVTLPIFFGITIIVLLKSKGVFTYLLEQSFLKKIGNISFSIYLNHFLIVLVFPRIIFELIEVPNNTIFQILVFTFCPLIVIFISKYTNMYIEIHLNNYLRKKFNAY